MVWVFVAIENITCYRLYAICSRDIEKVLLVRGMTSRNFNGRRVLGFLFRFPQQAEPESLYPIDVAIVYGSPIDKLCL